MRCYIRESCTLLTSFLGEIGTGGAGVVGVEVKVDDMRHRNRENGTMLGLILHQLLCHTGLCERLRLGRSL